MKGRLRMVCLVIWGLVFCVSCINHIEEEAEESLISPSDVPIKIAAKALHQQIYNKEGAEAIGLYILTPSASLSGTRYLDNVRFSCTSTGFEADQVVYYPISKDPCTLISYYPYQKKAVEAGETTMTVAVRTDQRLSSNYNASDFMTTQVDKITSSQKSVELTYTHQMCQLSIIIKPTESCDMSALKKSNPTLFLNDVYTKATYNFQTDELSPINQRENVIMNGEWEVDNGHLVGKRCLLIPQRFSADNEIITLTILDKKYVCQLSESYELEKGKRYELTLLYNPEKSITGIIPSINDWEQGDDSVIIPEEKIESDSLLTDGFDFSLSNVFRITHQGKAIAEVCKEYLLSDQIAKQAIVIYPIKEGKSDWRSGLVLRILNEAGNVHGGRVTWSNDHTLTYTPGSSSPINCFYIDSNQNIGFTRPSRPLLLSYKKRVVVDERGNETNFYPIVKIGTQYWTREDLKATLYNDGKKITAKTSSNYSKTTAGYFKEGSYFFYNKAAVITGRLAPLGWKVADNVAWLQLKEYIHQDASVLKGNERWKKSPSPINNLTGFHAIATGIFTKKINEDSSVYSFSQEYAVYWNMGENQESVSQLSILLSYNSNEIKDASYSDYCGYTIRCVQE